MQVIPEYAMKRYINKKYFTIISSLTFELIILIFSSSFTRKEAVPFVNSSEQIETRNFSESRTGHSMNSEKQENTFNPWSNSVTYLQDTAPKQVYKTNYTSTIVNFVYSYFPLVYSGFGVDHMNINLVNLASTGLIAGDEIGVFDSIYCVGSAVIEAKNIKDNSLSIPASANENLGTKPNGYIEGHKITLKTYRSGIIYQLYYQTVNNSDNIFEKGGSMFALVDFSRSEEENTPEDSEETIKIYPNPFSTSIRIEINLPKEQHLSCEIFDMTGRLIRTLYSGIAVGQQLLIWDGKDNRTNQVSTGIYFCRLNHKTTKITYCNFD
jgi:hypothetical protein